jgi:hypothetical protein
MDFFPVCSMSSTISHALTVGAHTSATVFEAPAPIKDTAPSLCRSCPAASRPPSVVVPEALNRELLLTTEQTESRPLMIGITGEIYIWNLRARSAPVFYVIDLWCDLVGIIVLGSLIGLGGSACGKTTVCKELQARLGHGWVVTLHMDCFYKSLPPDTTAATYNFDEPNAFDWPLFVATLQVLSTGKAAQVPQYSFLTHQRNDQPETLLAAPVILVDGTLTLHDVRVRRLSVLRLRPTSCTLRILV